MPLFFITFSFLEIQFFERKLKSDKGKDRIRTCNLRSKWQSANHYTVEAVVKEEVKLHKVSVDEGKTKQNMPFLNNYFLRDLGNSRVLAKFLVKFKA